MAGQAEHGHPYTYAPYTHSLLDCVALLPALSLILSPSFRSLNLNTRSNTAPVQSYQRFSLCLSFHPPQTGGPGKGPLADYSNPQPWNPLHPIFIIPIASTHLCPEDLADSSTPSVLKSHNEVAVKGHSFDPPRQPYPPIPSPGCRSAAAATNPS